MARPARFTFDLDLGSRPTVANANAPAPIPSIPEDLVSQLIAQAREEAYAEGVIAGERNASAIAAQTLAAAAGTLATQTAEMAASLDDATAELRREAVELAASVGRKLALHLLARFPTHELDALIAECMQSLNGVPHLVIRCNPAISDAIRDIATAHMQTSGFAGRLVVMGDPDLRLGDGRLEWVDGGLVRDIGAVSKDIDSKISAYLAARTGGQAKQEESGH
ncbi:MAG: FliH/SctL family protein [Candidatus Devosia phytovorans]|uniref:FliH/SctL family protein n=1 Tax=Candidatus Devosia phytovorans TaxID=3121372 RepID=A0AAJ5VW39_9HYPH|nr:FliH/SctL family protein [Devosia sp.]WEK04980.1 MAG: FliH/SctL family protein [Devosia sp.]